MLEMGNLMLLIYIFINKLDYNYTKLNRIINYFFIQIIRSMGLLLGLVLSSDEVFFFLLKIRSFPFFIWVVTIFRFFLGSDLFIISVITKSLPLFLFIIIIPTSSFLLFLFFLTS